MYHIFFENYSPETRSGSEYSNPGSDVIHRKKLSGIDLNTPGPGPSSLLAGLLLRDDPPSPVAQTERPRAVEAHKPGKYTPCTTHCVRFVFWYVYQN